jgi:polar amino acid transport system permease protein
MIQILHENWPLLLIGQYPHGPLGGLAMTLIVSIFSLTCCIPISVLFALAMTSGISYVARPVVVVVQLLRGIPLLMLLFWAYFALPLLTGSDIGPIPTLIGSLVIYKSAYLAEIIRGGIVALPKGQTEACHALGMNYTTRTLHIVLPQVIVNMLPSIVTQFVGIVKDTSIGYVIGANELAFAANQLNATLFTQPLEVFLLVATVYFVLNYLLTSGSRYLERRIRNRRTRPADSVTVKVAPA